MPTESDFRTGTVVDRGADGHGSTPLDPHRPPIPFPPAFPSSMLRTRPDHWPPVHSISPKPSHTSTYRAQMASSTRRRDDNHHARKI
ncbi:hypothetical protein PGT21_035653 [Puccinia graminis f. sp. tritici]|uniref:Uncharacterized protein n=1 Tax=Puccinia graminis f. sp. tritici TaxID=56615 RepID=A0A5B0MNT1_PUCGR|nr:hypothetical protein PGT21_035653 [Puccinia graminis f. sp. tritici]